MYAIIRNTYSHPPQGDTDKNQIKKQDWSSSPLVMRIARNSCQQKWIVLTVLSLMKRRLLTPSPPKEATGKDGWLLVAYTPKKENKNEGWWPVLEVGDSWKILTTLFYLEHAWTGEQKSHSRDKWVDYRKNRKVFQTLMKLSSKIIPSSPRASLVLWPRKTTGSAGKITNSFKK